MAPFDPYHQWLEIPPDEQPPTPHRLLGIAPDETDKEIIREAALQRNAFIRQFSLGEQGKIAERLLNEIAAARDNILAGNVQTAVETPLAVETPIEPVVEKADPFAGTPVSTPLFADRSPIAEPETQPMAAVWPIVQPAKKPRWQVLQEIWKRPAVIGVSLVGVIGVFVLFISMMFSGDADPVVSNTAGRISAEMAVETAAAEKAAIDKVVADKVVADKVVADKGVADKGVADKGVADKAAMEKAAMDKAAMDKAAMDKAAMDKAAMDKAAAEKAAILAGDPITNTLGMTFNNIPAGTFMMGSPEDETDRGAEETQHKVTITKAFYMQTTEVTQSQWKAVMGTEPWKGKDNVIEGANNAATYVSWNDAVAYCKKLSEKEGKTYRLPTEAEWEYACRAGTETRWSFGNDENKLGDYSWYKENAWDIDEQYAHHVGLKKSNVFGLYDMHGNTWEWCHDYYGEDYYKQSLEQDPRGLARGSSRVLRGGSWVDYSRSTRSAFRLGGVADYRNFDFGFRLVRELD
jgi:sulfatase modifying factor 1